MLRIRVPDPHHVTILLEHLRERGCIAYTAGDGIVNALLPEVPWREEELRIREAVADWMDDNPGVLLDVQPLDS